MKIIVKQFKDTLTVKDLQDVLNAQLKAQNLQPAGVNIYFKNYPEDLTAELPEGVEYSNLNTLVFDTDTNRATVYIQADASDFVKHDDLAEVKEAVADLHTQVTELKTEFEAVKRLLTEAQNDITEAEGKVNQLSQTTTASITEIKQEAEALKGKVEVIDKDQIGANKTAIETANGKITAIETKQTEMDGKIVTLTEKVTALETPTNEGA